MLQIDQLTGRAERLGRYQAGPGINRVDFLFTKQGGEIVRIQRPILLGLKTRVAKSRPPPFQVLYIGIEQCNVGLSDGTWPMTPHTPYQLDDRAHGRRLDNGPIVIVIAPNLGDGGAQHNEQMIDGVTLQAGAYIWQLKHTQLVAAIQRTVKTSL